MKHSLKKAITLHKEHLSGKAPTSSKSQMKMMKLMKAHEKEMTKTKKKKRSK